MGRMTYRRFALFNVTGGALWASIFLLLGYYFGTIEWVKNHLQILVVIIIVISVMPAVVEFLRERCRAKNRVEI
jgi:membrane-associated protein